MKKILKIIGWSFLAIIVSMIGFGIYTYQTNDFIRAIINNDESKLYYFPSKEIRNMEELKYTETLLNIDDSIRVNTYHFVSLTENRKANIFLIHGAGGNVTSYKKLIKPLVENSFNVYTLDWRGFGKSNGTPNYKGVLKDTEAAFKDFVKTTKNDSLPIIVYGMSLGGQLAVKITKDNQDKIDALILDSSIESAQSLAMDYVPIEFLKSDIQKHPENFNQDYVAVEDIKEIKNVPKLIIHSKKDKEIPFIRGENLFDAAKEPKIFWITESDHIMILADNPKGTIKKINNLLKLN